MKITFLCPEASPSGGNRVIAIYAEKLLKMGHDVTVVSRQPPKLTWKRSLINRLKGKGKVTNPIARTVHFDNLGTRHRWLPWKYPIDTEDLPDADVLVATWWRTAFEVTMMPPEKGAKAYFVQHHEIHDHFPRDLVSASYLLPLKKITIADWLVDVMAESYCDTSVVKVENSVDTELFFAPSRARNDVPCIGFVYSASHFKGLDVCISAIELARQRMPELRVLAFGAKPPVRKLPLPSGTAYYLNPSQEVLRELYSRCDVWLFGSRSEGFGLPILEAMACRTPVVATAAGIAPTMLEDGRAGRVVNVDDAQALAMKLIEVLELPPPDWKEMSENAFARVQGYSWDDAAAAFETALADIFVKNNECS